MLSQAVIQAGGKGTRMGSLSERMPKPMIEVAGKPVLYHQLEWCEANGIHEVIIVVGHLGSLIETFVSQNQKHFSELHIECISEPESLGTAGILPLIISKLHPHFLLIYGDVIFNIDLIRMFNFHLRHQAEATLVVHPNDHPYDSDLVKADASGRILEFLSKPHSNEIDLPNSVNAALYILDRNICQNISPTYCDFGRDLFPSWVKKHRIFAYSSPEYLKDMGTPERRIQVEQDVLSGKVARRNLNTAQKAIFLDRDGVLNFDTDLIHKPEDLELFPFTAAALKLLNRSEYLSIVVTNQSVVARNLTTLEGLERIHAKMHADLGKQGAWVDAVYFCPHHPHGGFAGENAAFKVDCECRKPKPGMILDAAKTFNIKLSSSFIIGDSERDIGAGQAAGLTTIGVRTGHGLKNSFLQPDYFFENVLEAVEYVLNDPFQSDAIHLANLIQKPSVIGIAGNSRSGKSVFTSRLIKELQSDGLNVFRIDLDDWIVPKNQRLPHFGVMENFRIHELEDDIERILNGESVSLMAYSAHPNRALSSKTYHILNADVVVIEGVVTLSSEKIRNFLQHKVFVHCEESLRKLRIKNLFLWKGLSEEEIETIYNIRQHNEYIIIEQDAVWADYFVDGGKA